MIAVALDCINVKIGCPDGGKLVCFEDMFKFIPICRYLETLKAFKLLLVLHI
jgi:hypothetical protein